MSEEEEGMTAGPAINNPDPQKWANIDLDESPSCKVGMELPQQEFPSRLNTIQQSIENGPAAFAVGPFPNDDAESADAYHSRATSFQSYIILGYIILGYIILA